MICRCSECGKPTEVLYPDHYKYQKNGKYFCTYTCFRKREEKELTPMQKVTLEQKKEAVQVALDGEDPVAFLNDCGSRNGALMWGRIMATLKDTDNETYRKIMDLQRRKRKEKMKAKKIETPEVSLADAMQGMKDAADDFFGACKDMGLKIETPEQPIIAPVQEKKTDFTVAALRHEVLGEFYYDRKYKQVDWRTNGGDEISLGPSVWKQLAELLPRIMKTLGVDE